MKVNSKDVKKKVKKIKHASKEEIDMLKEEYQKVIGVVKGMTSPILFVVSLVGIFVILYFRNNFIDFIGLIVFIYPFYLFVQKEGHKDGFFEGYYNLLKKDDTIESPEDKKESKETTTS